MQGAVLPIRSNLGFRVLLKDTSTPQCMSCILETARDCLLLCYILSSSLPPFPSPEPLSERLLPPSPAEREGEERASGGPEREAEGPHHPAENAAGRPGALCLPGGQLRLPASGCSDGETEGRASSLSPQRHHANPNRPLRKRFQIISRVINPLLGPERC